MTKINRITLKTFLIFLLLSTEVYTYGASTSSSSSTSTKSNPKKNSFESKWETGLNYSIKKNFDYNSDTYSQLLGEISYSASPHFIFSIAIGYLQPFKTDDEEMRYYGFEDMEFSFVFPKTVSGSIFSMTPLASLILPTSNASKLASHMGSVLGGVNLSFKVAEPLTLFTKHHLIGGYYEYDTVDDVGSALNYPFMLKNQLGLKLSLFNKLSLTGRGTFTWLTTYEGDSKSLQALALLMELSFTENIVLTSKVGWSDEFVTNNKFLDDDTTSYELGVGVNF